MKERNKRTKDCWPSSVQYDIIWGREQLYNPLSKSSSKEITNWLQEISTRAHKEQNLISTHFSQFHQWTKHSMIFTLQGDYNVSQRKRTSLQRHLTLKLPPLYYQVSLSKATCKTWRNKPFIVFRKTRIRPPNEAHRPPNSFSYTVRKQPYPLIRPLKKGNSGAEKSRMKRLDWHTKSATEFCTSATKFSQLHDIKF